MRARRSLRVSFGGGGEVALLRAVRVAERGEPLAAALEPLPGGPVALLGVDLVERGVRLLVEGDVVEDVELRLGPEVGDVGDAGRAQVLLRLASPRSAGRASTARA